MPIDSQLLQVSSQNHPHPVLRLLAWHLPFPALLVSSVSPHLTKAMSWKSLSWGGDRKSLGGAQAKGSR